MRAKGQNGLCKVFANTCKHFAQAVFIKFLAKPIILIHLKSITHSKEKIGF
jgi:hypothetical protein